jgi:hypothetical protein
MAHGPVEGGPQVLLRDEAVEALDLLAALQEQDRRNAS